MKILIIICLLFVNLGIAQADEAMTQNAAGEEIVILDETEVAAEVEKQLSEKQPTAGWKAKTQEVLFSALSLTGIKYKWGGKTPETGFDCSGFVRYVFQNATNLSLPVTAHAIAQIGQSIKRDELQPGDLVFFNTLKSTFSHVGIYIGDNKFVHAPRTGAKVRVEKMSSYWTSRFDGAKRLDSEAEKVESAN